MTITKLNKKLSIIMTKIKVSLMLILVYNNLRPYNIN